MAGRIFERRLVGAMALIVPMGLAGCAGTTAGPDVAAPPSTADTAAPTRSAPTEEEFAAWLAGVRQEALAAGISPGTLDRALTGLSPLPSVLAADSHQPEFTRPVWAYLDSAVSPTRIERGGELLALHSALFDRVETHYGVPREILAAIWAMESNFGANMGDTPVVQALATLGHAGRRKQYGREQLMAALGIVDRGDIAPERMLGSWAGAMGQTQFIPTTYVRYAVDMDGDGRRDLWTSLPDALASTAHYLASSGWRRGVPWGAEVIVPPDFDYALAELSEVRTVAEWRSLGVRPIAGILPAQEPAALLVPAGHQGPAFLVTDNFKAILKYNNSTAYALAVAHLADRFAGGGSIRGDWPRHEQPLNRDQRVELQRLLAARGLPVGSIDGIIGANTRAALRVYQREIGVPADGFATLALLERLRADQPMS